MILFQRDGDLWVVADPPTATDSQPVRITSTSFREAGAKLSPDGRWVAYASDESGRDEIYVQAFETASSTPSLGTARTQISSGGAAANIEWRGDGRELFYVSAGRQMMAVDITLGPTLRAGTPRALFRMPASDAWDVTGDGQRFLFALPAGDNRPPPFHVILNWDAGN